MSNGGKYVLKLLKIAVIVYYLLKRVHAQIPLSDYTTMHVGKRGAPDFEFVEKLSKV